MKQNGFTLIELIGVVAIIALVMLVTIPQVMSTMTKSSVKKTETFENDLELAAESYVENNWNTFKVEFVNKQKSGNYCLSLKTLMIEGYIKNTDIDPSTNSVIDIEGKYILLQNISNNGNFKFSFDYVDVNKAEYQSSVCNDADWKV